MASHASPPHRSRLVPPGPSVVGLVEIDRPDVTGTGAIVASDATPTSGDAVLTGEVAAGDIVAGDTTPTSGDATLGGLGALVAADVTPTFGAAAFVVLLASPRLDLGVLTAPAPVDAALVAPPPVDAVLSIYLGA